MRVILDANIFISYLLAPHRSRTITQVVERCFAEDIELFVPQELINEIGNAVVRSAYLRRHILAEDIAALQGILTAGATIPTPLESEISSYSQDSKDDYLIAYGLVYEVDYLVTGDPHLLVLGRVENLKIVRPRAFFGLAG